MTSRFQKGDWVVYRKTKFGECPTDRAVEVTPCEHGDGYTYLVDKYWVVESALEDRVIVRTRRGKRHEIAIDDRQFRPAALWERLLYRNRFVETAEQVDVPTGGAAVA